MKKRLVILAGGILWAVVAHTATAIPAGGEPLVFDKTVHDFGEVLEKDGRVSYTFRFTNKGSEPVVINRVAAECRCVGADFTKTPVKPGASGEITVSFNPWYLPGVFSREAVVIHSAGVSRLGVKGNVTGFLHPVTEDHRYFYGENLYMSLRVLAFGRVTKNDPQSVLIRYANDSDRPMTLDFWVEGGDKNLEFTPPGELKPQERGKMYFRYNFKKEFVGDREYDVYPVVNGKRVSEPLRVRVTGKDNILIVK